MGRDAQALRPPPLSRLLEPTIYYAEEGFPVTEIISDFWGSERAMPAFKIHPNAMKLYKPNGQAPKPGDVFRNPDLASSLKRIAVSGRDGFYEGVTAEAIVAVSKELGGTMTMADLSEYQPEWVEPISTDYHGWKVSELPPNGQGIAVLAMLNIMEHFPLEWGPNTAQSLHTMIEAKKLAYADLLKYVGDPRFSKMPVPEMISKPLAAERAKLIDSNRASCKVVPSNLISTGKMPGADTIYLSVIRPRRQYGVVHSKHLSRLWIRRGPERFRLHASRSRRIVHIGAIIPTPLAPRKRPINTIIPGFMEKGDITDRLRNHGWMESGASPCAVCLEHCRSWNEYSGCA